MPHTRPLSRNEDVICFSDIKQIYSISTLVHELWHIHQRKYHTLWEKIFNIQGWRKWYDTIPVDLETNRRYNPDTIDCPLWIFNEKWIPIPIFRDISNPKIGEVDIWFYCPQDGVRTKNIPYILKEYYSELTPIDAYENPREANGRIVCANCHLAQKPSEIEAPGSVLPNSVFEAVVKIPYDVKQKQVLGNGQKGGLNVGAVVILPEGFKLAPKTLLDEELKAKTKGVYITPYSPTKENILVVGPIAGEKNQEIIFPILSPDPEKDKNVFYVKYPIYAGANRGRVQVYPTGVKTNNNTVTAITTGKIQEIKVLDKVFEITIAGTNGDVKTQTVPKEVDLIVKENQVVQQDQPLTINPNVGGFGQAESEVVLQDPLRIYGYLAFCVSIIVTQSMFVFKKKQFEKVQLAELDF
jgi:apocytochrome f